MTRVTPTGAIQSFIHFSWPDHDLLWRCGCASQDDRDLLCSFGHHSSSKPAVDPPGVRRPRAATSQAPARPLGESPTSHPHRGFGDSAWTVAPEARADRPRAEFFAFALRTTDRSTVATAVESDLWRSCSLESNRLWAFCIRAYSLWAA